MSSVPRQVSFAAVLAGVAAVAPIAGWTQKASYDQMAPVSRYLIADRRDEVALARSAAPGAISLHATALVLGPHGYETAETGNNGFTCLVERSWMSPFDSTEFWNWKMRGPICYNPAASGAVLRYTIFWTNLALSGVAKSQMLERIGAAVADGRLPAPAPGSMSYMMSKNQYLGDSGGAWMSHLMFYAPKGAGSDAGASWGANEPGSPVVLDSSHHVTPEPETIFMIPVAHWSDGKQAPPT